jgi:hypothetical protein
MGKAILLSILYIIDNYLGFVLDRGDIQISPKIMLHLMNKFMFFMLVEMFFLLIFIVAYILMCLSLTNLD